MSADFSLTVVNDPPAGSDHFVDHAATKIAKSDAANHSLLLESHRLVGDWWRSGDNSQRGLGFGCAVRRYYAKIRSRLIGGRWRPVIRQRQHDRAAVVNILRKGKRGGHRSVIVGGCRSRLSHCPTLRFEDSPASDYRLSTPKQRAVPTPPSPG